MNDGPVRNLAIQALTAARVIRQALIDLDTEEMRIVAGVSDPDEFDADADQIVWAQCPGLGKIDELEDWIDSLEDALYGIGQGPSKFNERRTSREEHRCHDLEG